MIWNIENPLNPSKVKVKPEEFRTRPITIDYIVEISLLIQILKKYAQMHFFAYHGIMLYVGTILKFLLASTPFMYFYKFHRKSSWNLIDFHSKSWNIITLSIYGPFTNLFQLTK